MGILSRWLGTDTEPELQARTLPIRNPADLTFFGGQGASVVASQPVTALAQPTVFAAVRMISSAIQSMPWDSFLLGTRQRATDTPAIIRQPDPFHPREVTLKRIATMLLLRGEAFVWLTAHDRSGRPTVAIPVSNDEVVITWNETRTQPVYHWRGQLMRLGVDLGHMKYVDDLDLLHGIGPIQSLSGSIAGSLKGEQLVASQFTDGAWVDGVLQAPTKLTEKEAERLRAQWDQAHAGKRGTAVLEGGIEYKPVMMSNSDAQMMEGRSWYARDFARAFGVPAPLLGLTMGEGSSLTYQNIEGVKSQFAQFAVQPVTDVMEAAFTQWVPTTQHVLFAFAALLRADIATRFSVYDQALRSGVLTTNEVRALEGLPDIAGGDTLATQQTAPTADQEVNA